MGATTDPRYLIHCSIADQGKQMDLNERVSRAIANYTNRTSSRAASRSEVPNEIAYPFGWIIACAIVAARYRDSAIDAIPVYHPENGWDRFLFTRRVTCTHWESESANAFGELLLTGDDAPYFVSDTTQLAIGSLLRHDAEQAVARILDLVPMVGLTGDDHAQCWHERARHYPVVYDAVTELIIEHPGLVTAREIFVDDQRISNTFHPLYLHSVVTAPQMVYNWFEVAVADHRAFFRMDGEQSFYETCNGGWSTVQKQLVDEDRDGIKRRLLAWLRLNGEPEPGSID